MAAFVAVTIAFSSCQNSAANLDQPPPMVYASPVVLPLKLGKPVKLNWNNIKAVPVHPLVKPFDLDKLPAHSYDTAGFKPYKYPVEETRFDYNALPGNDLDIDKLPSRPMKFTTVKLAPPKLIHTGPPQLKDLNLSLFELGQAQGLMGGAVTCLFTDRDGFLWIATDAGLYRYNGENILWYVPVTAPHLIISMVQDRAGRIWISMQRNGGLQVLDLRDGTLKTADKSSGSAGNILGRIFQDTRQRIWVPNNLPNTLSIIDPNTQTIKQLDEKRYLTDTTANSITEDNNHNIWVSTFNGMNIIDGQNKKIKYLTTSNGLKSNNLGELLVDKTGRVWMAHYGGLLTVIDLQKKSIQTIEEVEQPKLNIIMLYQDKQGKIWVATVENGLEIMDPDKRVARHMKKMNGLNGDFVINITPDSQGQVWIATITGLNMIGDNNVVMERIGKAQAFYLAEDKQGLEWENLASGGVDVIDRKSKTIRHLGASEGFSGNNIGLANDINGKIYISSFSGLHIVDASRKTLTHIGKAQGFSGQAAGLTTAADKAGRIWITETDGLGIFDPKNNTTKHIGKAEGLSGDGVDCVQADTRGQIWISTNSGEIKVIDPSAFSIQNVDTGGPVFKDAGPALGMLADKNGNMWIGTNKGIFIVDTRNKTLTTFSAPQGLIDDHVGTLLQHGNQIYAVTVNGITVITPPAEGMVANKKWGIQSFGNEYGLKKLSPNYGGTDAMSADGHVLWADYGLSVLDLSKKDTTVPPAYITGVNIMDQPANFTGRSHTVLNGITWDGVTGPFNAPVNLQLPHDQNYVQFNFGSLNFRTRDTTWYTYKLVGKDTGWSAKTTFDHSRNYFGLAPGKYTFEVSGKSSDNGWSKPSFFSFSVVPPWWQTWWAFILYVLLFGGTIWGVVTLRSRQLIKEKRILEHKVHVRTEEVIQQKEEIEAQRDHLEKSFKELKNAQTQLVQSEKMASLGELTAGIAHEIQNPLNFVNNFSEVNTELIEELQEEIDKGNYEEVKAIAGDIKGNQQKISQHGKRADFIVKGMLLHSRNNSGERQLTNVNVLADEFFKLSYHGLRAKDKNFNAEMTTHFAENLPAITVVQQDIGRVMLNLFNNAFYATNQKAKTAGAAYKPEVTVSTAFENGGVIIKVKDNGVGIPDAIKEKIMQPFFTTKPTGEGTGLGLSLTYDMVVKGHGGSIQVDSKEGEGSAFIISLPMS